MADAEDIVTSEPVDSPRLSLTRSLEDLFAMIREAVVVLDLEMRITHASQALPELLGYSVEDLKARSVSDFLEPEDLLSVSVFDAPFRGGTLSNLKISLVAKDGERIPVTTRGTRLYDGDAQVVGYVVSFQDSRTLSAELSSDAADSQGFLKRNQELAQACRDLELEVEQCKAAQSEAEEACVKAEEASRLKSEFLANMSHELRTPLNAIINVPHVILDCFQRVTVWNCEACTLDFVDEEQDGNVDDSESNACPECEGPLRCESRLTYTGSMERFQRLLQQGEASGRHLLELINNLLDSARLEVGKVVLRLRDVSVAEVVINVEDMLRTLAAQKNIELSHNLSEPGFVMVADPMRIQQVLVNLVGNALKFTDEGGAVTVSVTSAELEGGEAVDFSVRDNGVGIPEKHLEEIFETFQQVDGTHTRAHEGTGLGLPIARSLVELHGGRMSVESKVDEGSCFSFVIPVGGPEGETD